MRSAIDTNVLLDILVPGAPHAVASKKLLDDANGMGGLVICEVVYAELAGQFPSKAALDGFLTATGIQLTGSNTQALNRAGEAWRAFSRGRRRRGIACPECGKIQAIDCSACGTSIQSRQHVVADFLIGAHALFMADRLLSRDRGFYRTHFAELMVAAPNSPAP